MATHSSCLENLTDRGALRVTIHGVERVGYDLANKQLPYIAAGFFIGFHENQVGFLKAYSSTSQNQKLKAKLKTSRKMKTRKYTEL